MGATGTDSASPPWLWIAAIWFSVGLFDATQTVVVMRTEGMQHAWAYLFVTLLLLWLPWALATPLVMRLCCMVRVSRRVAKPMGQVSRSGALRVSLVRYVL